MHLIAKLEVWWSVEDQTQKCKAERKRVRVSVYLAARPLAAAWGMHDDEGAENSPLTQNRQQRPKNWNRH